MCSSKFSSFWKTVIKKSWKNWSHFTYRMRGRKQKKGAQMPFHSRLMDDHSSGPASGWNRKQIQIALLKSSAATSVQKSFLPVIWHLRPWNKSLKIHTTDWSRSHVQALPVLHTYYVFNNAHGKYISHYFLLILLDCISLWSISSIPYQYSFSTILFKTVILH